MSEETTVRVKYGTLEATLKLHYRWYVSGSDPWELLNGMHIVPYGGYWYDRPFYEGDVDREIYDKKGNLAIKFVKFDREKKWSSGRGIFYGFGGTYNIPKYANITWVITDFD